MKLRNKKTGEIGWLYCDHISIPKKMTVFAESENLSVDHWDYATLAELNEDWEDVPEEPKEYCYITSRGNFHFIEDIDDEGDKERKQIGNYFDTREEAEKAVEKLKAWKRLKDKGFQITDWDNSIGDDYYKTGQIVLNLNNVIDRNWDEYGNIDDIKADLNLLFGGEE